MESSKVLYEIGTQIRNITFYPGSDPVYACRDLIRNLFEMADENERELLIRDLVWYSDKDLFKNLVNRT